MVSTSNQSVPEMASDQMDVSRNGAYHLYALNPGVFLIRVPTIPLIEVNVPFSDVKSQLCFTSDTLW